MIEAWEAYRLLQAKWDKALRSKHCGECGVKLDVIDNLESNLCHKCENMKGKTK